ncbi:MAG: hypothetical protein MJ189_05505 [Coriobacteriales bacterium]|nr:hypothetical protein [Coriobacteriales bacterium]
MYSICYVVVDNEKLRYYNQLMKSLTSLKMYNPKIKVNVICDKNSYNIFKSKKCEIFKKAKVKAIDLDESLGQAARSRFLKVNLRKFVKGDYLYMDTDTVVCKKLPDIKSNKSVALSYDFHIQDKAQDLPLIAKVVNTCGIDLSECEHYYNSGVMWVKDDKYARKIYKKWNKWWKISSQSKLAVDQPALNRALFEEKEHVDVLDGTWNVMLSTYITGINYLADAKIIHYLNDENSPYKLAHPEYQALDYNDPKIIEILKNPRSQFEECRVVGLDKKYRLNVVGYSDIINLSKRIKKDANWSWNHTVKPFIANKIRSTKDEDKGKTE